MKIRIKESAEFGFREVHFGVCVHEGLEFVLFLHFVAAGKSLLFLLLIEHHLFDGGAGLAVEVGQFGVLGLDLLRVDFGVALEHAAPPAHLVDLRERELQDALLAVALERPQRVLRLDLLAQLLVDDRLLALHAHLQVLALHLHIQLLRRHVVRQPHVHRHFLQGLHPSVPVCLSPVA